jgi:hypothetical protein
MSRRQFNSLDSANRVMETVRLCCRQRSFRCSSRYLNYLIVGRRTLDPLKPEIKIDLSLLDAKPPLRALADVTLCYSEGAVKLRRCSVFHKPGEPPWAKLPGVSIEKQGKKQFVPLIELSREQKKRVVDALLDEYRRKTSEN